MGKRFAVLTFIFCFLAAHILVNAAEKTPPNGTTLRRFQDTQVFVNKNCEKSDSCDLKSFSLTPYYYQVWVGDQPSYGSGALVEYETSNVKDLENYVFVSFVRGCLFNSIKAEDGSVAKSYGFAIRHFGKAKTYCFPEWTVVSGDNDPAYKSENGRHYLYRWNSVHGSHDAKTQKFYGEGMPSEPRLYVFDPAPPVDLPNSEWATNVSLETKGCLYKAKDVPMNAVPGDTNFGAPVQCFLWKAIYIYNYSLRKFENKQEIDPFCLQKPEEKATAEQSTKNQL